MGYQRSQPPNKHFYPLWAETTGLDEEKLILYRPFFDLHRFDPFALSHYPVSVTFSLHGLWKQVQPYLVDELGSSLPDEVLSLDPRQNVIVKGNLQSTVPPRLTVNEFYYLDGGCELMTSSVQQCKFYQLVEFEE